jgi:hypothetical protein
MEKLKMKEYVSPHCLEREKERGVPRRSVEHTLGNIVAEYGWKEHPDAEPKPLAHPHRRAFLVQDRGVQGVIKIYDASEDVLVHVTVITLPHAEWGPLPKKYQVGWISNQKKRP